MMKVVPSMTSGRDKLREKPNKDNTPRFHKEESKIFSMNITAVTPQLLYSDPDQHGICVLSQPRKGTQADLDKMNNMLLCM